MHVYIPPALSLSGKLAHVLCGKFFHPSSVFFLFLDIHTCLPVMKFKSRRISRFLLFNFFFIKLHPACCLSSPLCTEDMTGKLWPQRGPNGAGYCTNINQSLFSEMDDSCSVSDYPSAHYP